MRRPGMTKSLTLKCTACIAVCGLLLQCLTACTDKQQSVGQTTKAGNGPMSDSIPEIQPQSPTATTAKKADTPAVTESQIGIPFYPGALPAEENGVQAPVTANTGMATTLLQTSDSVDKVVAFYMDSLKHTGDDGKPEAPHRLDSTLDGKPVITVSEISGRTVRAAEIRQVDNRTVIELMHMDVPERKSGSLPNHIPGPDSGSAPAMPGSMGAPPPGMPTTSQPGVPGTPTPTQPGTPGAPQPGVGLKYP